ncbi:MAG: 50S ribosomal protein L9 [Deltaproteobacteria bacterium]|jgi:large subunit ribosomal protein L9|nr:50S ribosomal protein L9 [Deltaproteobacteria bacterium]
MEIILTKDVYNLGLAGQVIKVAPGYARNFLLPSGSAKEATKSNLRALARKREEFETRAKEAKNSALAQKVQLSSLVLTMYRKSGDKGRLYGAVTPADIVAAAEEQGFSVDRKRLRLAEPIKTLGDFEVSIKLHQDVTATIKVKVLPLSAKEQVKTDTVDDYLSSDDGSYNPDLDDGF